MIKAPSQPISSAEFDVITRMDLRVFTERVFSELNPSTPYSDNFHIGVMVDHLEQVRRGNCLRLAMACPPRSLKSIVTSVAYTAWLLGHNPSCQIICVSYGQVLADKLATDCRQIMQSSWYKRVFPRTRLTRDRQAVGTLTTTEGGSRFATSVGGVLTGLGADFIIVDDPMKPDEAMSDVERTKVNVWVRSTLFTRLNNKITGAIVIVMQRLHQDDLIGHLNEHGAFEYVAFSAIASEDEKHTWNSTFGQGSFLRRGGEALHPDREPIEVLRALEKQLGTPHFSSQYLQLPMPPGGFLIDISSFARFDLAHPPAFDCIIQSWDTANTVKELSDYSVCTTWGKKGKYFYLIHVRREKLEFPDLLAAVVIQARQHGAIRVLIEEAASGTPLIQQLKRDGFYNAVGVKPTKDKVFRLRAHTALIQNGFVFLPAHAPWLAAYEQEMMMFPTLRYDDQVDSTTQALDHLTSYANGQMYIDRLEAQARAAMRGY